MIFKDEVPNYIVEYEEDKLFITGHHTTGFYLVNDWSSVRYFKDPNSANTFQKFAFPLPNLNGLIAVCSAASLSIFNVQDGSSKPLINQAMSVLKTGMQSAFAKTEEYGMSMHFVNKVIDKEGSGQKLIQYSYISLKQDALHWLKEIGRLPSTSMDEYFEESKALKLLNEQQKPGQKKEKRVRRFLRAIGFGSNQAQQKGMDTEETKAETPKSIS